MEAIPDKNPRSGNVGIETIQHLLVTKVGSEQLSHFPDKLALEEPLEIRLRLCTGHGWENRNISVTMRTPGNDAELAAGFLFTEGIVCADATLSVYEPARFVCQEGRENTITLQLEAGIVPDLNLSERNFYTTSSCGVCGKSSIAAIKTVSRFPSATLKPFSVSRSVLFPLSDRLRDHQTIFSATGGLHGCAFFDLDGNLLIAREDVGRHNALDKLIGASLYSGQLPLSEGILVLSGRASFELIQKSAMAGIQFVAAIGAPSSLAVNLAEEFNMTLIGFLKKQHFNIYTGVNRIKEII